jgi:dihydrofolate reductase
VLIFSMGMSVDGFVTDREGGIGWSVPSDELFRFHLDRVRGLGATLLGRRLYQTMLVWENDPAFRETEFDAAFAEVWSALPKVVFSRTLDSVQGNARLATGSVAEEVAAALKSAEHVEIGGAALAAQAIQLGLVEDFRLFRYPIVLGGGTPYLPPVTAEIRLDLVQTKVFDVGVVHERYLRAPA